MKRSEEDRWVTELLAGEEVSGFRRTSLEHGLAAMRRRRRSRRLARTGALALLPLGLLAAVVFPWPHPSETRRARVGKTQPGGAPAAALKLPPVKFITDDQLLALFPDRPLALVGPPGHQRLIFFDEPAAESPQAPGADR